MKKREEKAVWRVKKNGKRVKTVKVTVNDGGKEREGDEVSRTLFLLLHFIRWFIVYTIYMVECH